MSSKTIASRVSRAAGMDFHVLATLLSRGWAVVAGALTVLLVPLSLSSTQQGYYYTFASLLGLQVLVELGLGQVILQMVSHEMAHLRITPSGGIEGDAQRRDRLASLLQLLCRWYRIAALLFVVFAGSAGAYFLQRRVELPVSEWLGIWCVLVLSTAFSLSLTPAVAFAEGCGQIGQVARLRLIQSIIGYIALWLALISHAGLWAACMVPLVAALATALWLRHVGKTYRGLLGLSFTPANGLRWRRDLLPLQWRIALSALSGYFLFYLLTPMVFAHRGAAEAGQFGIAMTVFNALATVGTSWVYARTPLMAQHVSRNERAELNAVFKGVLKRSLVFTTIAVLVFVMIVWALRSLGVQQAFRISDLPVLLCLAIVCVANCIIFSAAAYMRAHREEPMLWVSLFGGAATALIAYYSSHQSVLAMSIGYAAVTACVLLPWTLLLLARYYHRR